MSAAKKPTVGTGGHGRKALEGKGPTPPAEMRPGHPRQRRAAAASRSSARSAPAAVTTRRRDDDIIAGRNPVLEALEAAVPAERLYVAIGVDLDRRVVGALTRARSAGIDVREVQRTELDRLTAGAVHQGLALAVGSFDYADVSSLLASALDRRAPLIVALDQVTDPRNLGAVIRSVAAFGGHGVIVPERRAAHLTASAWKASAGAAARVPIAKATNLVRTLEAAKKAGYLVAGLAADADTSLTDPILRDSPLLLVVGSEGDGLARLTAEHCDVLISIPMASGTESLNASVAASIALYALTRGSTDG
jgi:23S rRNA (guanosine2251-2'-O)-methyltransferase